jgi:hypothetical protein
MKKIISTIILTGLCSLIFCTPNVATFNVYGATQSSNSGASMVADGLSEPTQEELDEEQAYYNTPEMQAVIAEKEARAAAFSNSNNSGISTFSKNSGISTFATTAGYEIAIPGTFTIYSQEEPMYCVPASLKSIIKYIKGSSPSQFSIASSIGTSSSTGSSISKAYSYLKKKVSFNYIRTTGLNKSNFLNDIRLTIGNDGKPCMVGLKFPKLGDWKFSLVSTGHCVVLNAIWSDLSKVQVADPNITPLKNQGVITDPTASPFYYIDALMIHNAYTRGGTSGGLIW